MHFNSDDLENGNAERAWRPALAHRRRARGVWNCAAATSRSPRQATPPRGRLRNQPARSGTGGGRRRAGGGVPPASSDDQRSLLRLANNGEDAATATINGVDDAGAEAGPLTVMVPAGEALTLTAAQLEAGGEGLEGVLGDGEGQWRLTVSFDNPLTVMSLMESPAGHLSNLSATARP